MPAPSRSEGRRARRRKARSGFAHGAPRRCFTTRAAHFL
jgi:hypothetical protein